MRARFQSVAAVADRSRSTGDPVNEPDLFSRAAAHQHRIALVAPEGLYTYRDLLDASERVARRLLSLCSTTDLEEARVAFLVPPGFEYVAVQWGIWRAGGIALPLAVSHPPPELARVIEDSRPVALVVHESLTQRVRQVGVAKPARWLDAGDLAAEESGAPSVVSPLPALAPERRGLMIYTSGTTGRPKGVVTTFRNIEAQITTLVEAWEWSSDDHILLVLPLHHVHGIINVLTCALWSGACCQILPRFDATETWERFARADLSLFMAVPTTYSRLVKAWEGADVADRARWTEGARSMRLMVSGSAALPLQILERWQQLTGHELLERYGMTEIGMALADPLHGERVPGHVGHPLPGVEVRRVDERGEELSDPLSPGELEIRGASVFSEYWGSPAATTTAFRDGWFRTGDVAVETDGHYRLLGRTSVDIIKTGGHKVSALEIEEVMRENPDVRDCAVVGVPDPEWGERVSVALIGHEGGSLNLEDVGAWARDRLAPYKVPRNSLVLEELPRNSMGKVLKQEVKSLFESPTAVEEGHEQPERGDEET